ncbi:vanadium-dependent bromoperoxidase, vBPO [Chondrus crispus]|uniref:Vanadium-dependent bromoperoxidase, vBPO n=1 Tax=Chondrus crispus TaxID=2769 RepID=R7QTB2_CHOCR|nr:vanadium-dependent bromoperoxidase, vBPO [Chondrus crispus]CDF40600.1 vanadium-dependent bromoperoxidase, vBPO [Chondrus crispus]|eukprot:XP_005710894.1 vanadium-dependent bromoperoxidase, vBPO [Chondrus crispus]
MSDMSTEISPRQQEAYDIRVAAATLALARDRKRKVFEPNGEEDRYFRPNSQILSYLGSYTKGLPHNRSTALVTSPNHFVRFVQAIDSGEPADFIKVPLGPRPALEFTTEEECIAANLFKSGIATRNDSFDPACLRAWESMGAGLVFDLEGPDAQAVGMPPAPTLDSDELVAEISELYWMALLRDVRFTDFTNPGPIRRAINTLNRTTWIRAARDPPDSLTPQERARLRGPFNPSSIFRGTLPGDDVGPYLSQFLLVGTEGIGGAQDRADGFISYGAHRIDQRVRHATKELDYMTSWEAFLDVQNGADVAGRDTFESGSDAFRFITTPRDLATYVHFDALYQAYLNACLILLDNKVKFDQGIPMGEPDFNGNQGIPFQDPDFKDHQRGFAHFGGPHILSLVTEVATRALKAVRFQKFNTHRRLRPEAVGGLIERFNSNPDDPQFQDVKPLFEALDEDMLRRVASHNREQNERSDFGMPRADDFNPAGDTLETMLLPMAFPEGSPMHPSYGAGHATVAGACVTVLKAFFQHDATLDFCYVPSDDGSRLDDASHTLNKKLTVEGELNKVCSNISIGRNWAGVHYFTDYIESILLGEQIALGILEEQMLTFPETFTMTVPLFSGGFRTLISTSDP